MKKSLAAILVTAAAAATISFSSMAAFVVEPDFEPNADYDKYTVLEYTIEALNTDIVATISAKEDDSEFEIHCEFYGDEQIYVGTWDGTAVTDVSDKTGFMKGDAPDIWAAALEADNWEPVGGAAEAEGETEMTAAEAVDFGVEPDFEPNADYDKYTVLEYTIEALNTDIVATISAKEDDSEFEIHCEFYGDEQIYVGTWDGTAVTDVSDKTGFMKGDAPDIWAAALENDLWAAIGGAPAEAETEVETEVETEAETEA